MRKSIPDKYVPFGNHEKAQNTMKILKFDPPLPVQAEHYKKKKTSIDISIAIIICCTLNQ